MIKSFNEMRKVDISKHLKKRDGVDYLNWADCKALLHENGAEKVYFIPLVNSNGSSLFMSEKEFIDKSGVANRCYETRIHIVIDDLEFDMQSPVMNGANPVKDNSMSQQRVWNSMTRSFVKGVAIYTGLGFDLWASTEREDENENYEDNLQMHNIFKIKQRVEEMITNKIANGTPRASLLGRLGLNERTFKQYMEMFDRLNEFEKAVKNL